MDSISLHLVYPALQRHTVSRQGSHMPDHSPSCNQHARQSASSSDAEATQRSVRSDDVDVSTADLLELLADDYAREILTALSSEPMSASDVIEATGITKVTTYRRLDRLESAGLVASTMVIDPDGHHHARYRLCCDRVNVRFGEDGVDSSVSTVSAIAEDE